MGFLRESTGQREMMMFEMIEEANHTARIKVIGVGGGGGNALNSMVSSHLDGVEFVAMNTDAQALGASLGNIKIQLGAHITRGLGAGANPDVGRRAAIEDEDRIRDVCDGVDMLFITAGLGGGTGTGAAPIIAGLAKEMGTLTVAVVTKPFLFEGNRRQSQSEEGLRELRKCVDTLITIPNQRLLSVAGKATPMREAFKIADNILCQAVQGISDLITVPGLINLDFADVRTIMSEMGIALMGTGSARGESRAVEAAQRAIASPLLEESSIEGARGVLINITGGPDLTLHEVNEAASLINDTAHEDANVIFGAVIDDNLNEEVRVTVIATGFVRPESNAVPVERKRKAVNDRDDLDVPTVIRRRSAALLPDPNVSVFEPHKAYEERSLDVPTFLRRKAD